MRIAVWVVRGTFILLSVFVAVLIERTIWPSQPAFWGSYDFVAMVIGLTAAVVLVTLDIIFRNKSIAVVLAVSLGLIVGALLEWLVAYILIRSETVAGMEPRSLASIELAIMLFFCYVAVTVILQTREDFRLVIPYMQFQPHGAGPRPMVLDTSVIIDGRIADICDTFVFDNALVVPRFVLLELQHIADSADRLKRNRGRRGLDMLNRLQRNPKAHVEIRDLPEDVSGAVDTKLIRMAKVLNGRVVTNDFNLSKIAQLQAVEVVNINDLAKALRPVVLPGEELQVKIIRPGDEPGQGVGYLDDGTMVVVENGKPLIGNRHTVIVSNVYQTSAGRMIFAKPANAPSSSRGRNSGGRRS